MATSLQCLWPIDRSSDFPWTLRLISFMPHLIRLAIFSKRRKKIAVLIAVHEISIHYYTFCGVCLILIFHGEMKLAAMMHSLKDVETLSYLTNQ
jgi:hypothetical protein